MAHLKKILSEVVHEIIKAIKLSMLPCKVLTYLPTYLPTYCILWPNRKSSSTSAPKQCDQIWRNFANLAIFLRVYLVPGTI